MKQATEKLRNISFWIIDFLKGSPVKNHLKDIKFILENFYSKESIKKRAFHLDCLLNHATQTTPFYDEFKNFKLLSDFPVINKIIINENSNEFRSEKFEHTTNHITHTSGSSGTMLTLLKDTNKINRNTADTIYFKKQAGFELGDRLYYIRQWDKLNIKNPFTTWLRNVQMVDVTKLSEKYLADFIKNLKKDNSRKAMLGYSSAYRDICRYLDSINSMPINTNISCIIAMSETLSDHTKQSLEKYFNAPVISRYSNLENGILSMQLPNQGSNFHINWASYHVELLHPEHDTPVEYGELGRVVITDLFNYCMPVIRYDTGDMAVMTDDHKFFNKAPAMVKVEGRKMDIIYDTKGNPLSPYIVYHMDNFPQLKQFQLIQESEKTYILKLNVDEVFSSELELISRYKDCLGEDADIEIEYVNEIPQLSSGKRRLTVNNYLLRKEEFVS